MPLIIRKPWVRNVAIVTDRHRINNSPFPRFNAIQQRPEIAIQIFSEIFANNSSGGEKRTTEPYERAHSGLQSSEPHFISHIKTFPARLSIGAGSKQGACGSLTEVVQHAVSGLNARVPVNPLD